MDRPEINFADSKKNFTLAQSNEKVLQIEIISPPGASQDGILGRRFLFRSRFNFFRGF